MGVYDCSIKLKWVSDVGLVDLLGWMRKSGCLVLIGFDRVSEDGVGVCFCSGCDGVGEVGVWLLISCF